MVLGTVKDKVVVITGGSKGMGRAFADRLAAEGARVAIVARGSSALDAVASVLGASGLTLPCDVGEPDQAAAAIARVVAHFGRLDVLINNAAMTTLTRVEDATPAQIQRELAVNLAGPMILTAAAVPHLRAARGDLVFISSESVSLPYPFLGLYAATKGGLETFSKAMRAELREDGVRVSTLRSGGVAGSSLGEAWPEATKAAFFETIQKTGHAAMTGGYASQDAMASALLMLLTLPSELNVDLLDIRVR